MEKKTYKQCQSCGMPLKKDLEGGGSESDGTRSSMYCSSCYKNGAFTEPDITPEQMIARNNTILKEEMHWTRFMRWLAKKQIPKLERWKTK